MIDNVKVDLPQALLQVVLLLLQLLDSLLVAQLNPGWFFFENDCKSGYIMIKYQIYHDNMMAP